jgi:hypothetical protein
MTVYATKMTLHTHLTFIAILDSKLNLKGKGKEACFLLKHFTRMAVRDSRYRTVASCRLRLPYHREKTFCLFDYEYCQTGDVVGFKASLHAAQKRENSTVV